jgi:hypothetical protein
MTKAENAGLGTQRRCLSAFGLEVGIDYPWWLQEGPCCARYQAGAASNEGKEYQRAKMQVIALKIGLDVT